MQYDLTRKQKKIVIFSCLILVTGLMSMDLISPSLPYIMQSLQANESDTKLLIVYYMIGLGLSQFFYGTFSDNYGRKKTILLSYGISMIGIALSGSSYSIEMLYLARFINGVGNGGATVIARAVISDVCEQPKALKQAFSYFTMFGLLSPAFAPVLGGFIQQYYNNWRVGFIVLFCTTVISCGTVLLFMPETHTVPRIKSSFLEQGRLYRDLLKSKKFMIYNLCSALIYVFSIAYYAYMPFILVKINFSPLENGLLYCLYALSLFTGSFALARYLNKFDSNKVLLLCGYGFLLTALLFYFYFYLDYSMVALIILSITIALICGISAPLTLALCMHGFSSDKKGASSAVQSFVKMFFTGLVLLLFNFIPLKSMASLLLCYLLIALAIVALLVCDRFSTKLVCEANKAN